MAETVNISSMAEIISKEITTHFGWSIYGPRNENFSCVEQSHNRKTHPADVVFAYAEPYEDKITHILCDLKSYSKNSIKPLELKKAIENLNESLTCARKSIDWNKNYVHTSDPINIKGMLFIFNNDNQYDSDFFELFKKATEKIVIDKGNVISVIGPKKICYLANICSNIERLRGKKDLPDEEFCGFFYPEQPIRNIYHDPARLPLTIEQIGGSFHIYRYSEPKETNTIGGLDVYMEDKENEFENFQHLFDYLRKYNCLQSVNKVRIFIPFSKETTRNNFQKALKIYEQTVDENFAKKLNPLINYEHINRVVPHFFSKEIGLRNE
ncbi:hypothetical protein [Desulfonatronum lacustre]|uniref:hypothetical protein n=1 Tax=Desulfonatronum lacustre TaxID=66849 RepID=UPI0012EBE79F|nr:hypothetical protein [Desulfonatronum lacustre]